MRIMNLTKRCSISDQAKLAVTFFDRMTGLLNKNNPRSLVFYTRFGLHTFGLSNPIDIILLDNSNRVVKLTKDLGPNRFFFYNPLFRIVIELPKGSIDRSGTALNDKIKFE